MLPTERPNNSHKGGDGFEIIRIGKNEIHESKMLEELKASNGDYPLELFFFYEGLYQQVDHDLPYEKPPWYDEKKFKRGRKFANDYYGSISGASITALLILFSFKGSLDPLIYTRKSDSKIKATKRYISTGLRVLSWYEGDIWDVNSAAYKNIQLVRGYHKNTARMMNQHTKEELEKMTNLGKILERSEINCTHMLTLKKDFNGQCPVYLEALNYNNAKFSQTDMSFTLFGFMGLVILYPEKLGIVGVSDAEIEGFVHLWKVIGYVLGVKDEFNLCNGSLSEVRQKCYRIVNSLFIPNLPNLTEEWEHMSWCVTEGVSEIAPGASFESILLNLFWLIDVKPTHLFKHLKWKYIIGHYIKRYVVMFIFRIKVFRDMFNSWLKKQLRTKEAELLKNPKYGGGCCYGK